jgi:hypothetical protein
MIHVHAVLFQAPCRAARQAPLLVVPISVLRRVYFLSTKKKGRVSGRHRSSACFLCALRFVMLPMERTKSNLKCQFCRWPQDRHQPSFAPPPWQIGTLFSKNSCQPKCVSAIDRNLLIPLLGAIFSRSFNWYTSHCKRKESVKADQDRPWQCFAPYRFMEDAQHPDSFLFGRYTFSWLERANEYEERKTGGCITMISKFKEGEEEKRKKKKLQV